MQNNLKKCPLHKFGSTYSPYREEFYQCDKCGAFCKVDPKMIEGNEGLKCKITKFSNCITYEF